MECEVGTRVEAGNDVVGKLHRISNALGHGIIDMVSVQQELKITLLSDSLCERF